MSSFSKIVRTNQNGNYQSHVLQNFPSLLSISADCSQHSSTQSCQRVIKVLAPVEPTSPTAPFSQRTLVTNGNHFGFVSKIKADSHTPIQISWWSSGTEKFFSILWLSLNCPAAILEQLYNNPEMESHLRTRFNRSEYLKGKDYLQTDLQAAWKAAFSSHLEERKSAIGMFGFKISDRTVQSIPKTVNRAHNNPHFSYDYRFGIVVELDPKSEKPVSIQWEHEESTYNYSLPELQDNFISPIVLVKLSDQVGYEISGDRLFYQAIVGFASKSVARSWWRTIKKELGDLSDLKPHYHPEIQHLKNQMIANYFYLAPFPRQKTLNARLRHLQTVASWDLTKHLHK